MIAVLSLSVPGPISDLTAIPGVIHVDISWSPTLEPNGVINDYEVCHRIHSAVMNTIEYLHPNTDVTLSVRAYTNVGPGEVVLRNVSTTHVRN